MNSITANLPKPQSVKPGPSDEEIKKCHKGADDFLSLGPPDAAEWARNPVPAAPMGRVKFEVARQVATFAVPVLLMCAAGLTGGRAAALLSVPVAALVGYLLDAQLMSAISKKTAQESAATGRRYLLVTFIAERFDCPVAQVTLAKIKAMAQIHRNFTVSTAAKEVVNAARREANDVRGIYRNRNRNDWAPGAAAGAMATGGAVAYASQDDSVIDVSHMLEINPANGMPMISGTMIDVTGHTFGTDGF